MTVVANAEFAQSYSAQETTGRRSSTFSIGASPRCPAGVSRSRRQVLARFAELDARVALERQGQIDPGGSEVHERSGMILREIVERLGAQLLDLARVGAHHPARRHHVDRLEGALH